MKLIKKIQPKTNPDIDLEILTQRIREVRQESKNEETPSETVATKPKVATKPRSITKNEVPRNIIPKKKAGRKKQNTEEMHRFAIDLPLWLFEKMKSDADESFSTVRGQILKLLLAHYKS